MGDGGFGRLASIKAMLPMCSMMVRITVIMSMEFLFVCGLLCGSIWNRMFSDLKPKMIAGMQKAGCT